jgi:hypothetical protein
MIFEVLIVLNLLEASPLLFLASRFFRPCSSLGQTEG